MFIEKDDLKSVIYNYQIDQITEADDDIIEMSIGAAIDEAKSYLMPNGKGQAPSYDVAAIFGATGTDRNSLLMEMTKSIALWNLIRLCNADILFENAKDRYDRAIAWFKSINKGDTRLDLPVITIDVSTDAALSFRSGSRKKFVHE